MSKFTLVRNNDLLTQPQEVINTVITFMRERGHEDLCNTYSVLCDGTCIGLIQIVHGKGVVSSPYNNIIGNSKLIAHVENLYKVWQDGVSSEYKGKF